MRLRKLWRKRHKKSMVPIPRESQLMLLDDLPMETQARRDDDAAFGSKQRKDEQSSRPPPPALPPPGFRNWGNTCYANAALQCLLSTTLSHALLDPKTIHVLRKYSFNASLLENGSGSVDSDDDIISESCSDFLSESEVNPQGHDDDDDDILQSRTGDEDPLGVVQGRVERREARQEERKKRKELARKERERQRAHEKCKWLTRELTVITRDYTFDPTPPQSSSEDDASSSSPSGGSYGICLPFVGGGSRRTKVSPHNRVVDPGGITKSVDQISKTLRPYQQEDAHEFLRSLLSALVMDGHNRELSSLFDGLLESAVTCKVCNRSSLTRDRYMDLSLDIADHCITDLNGALRKFTETETLDGDNCVTCERCDQKRPATKGLRLATAPTVLVTHLKRFAFDRYGRTVRLSKRVAFPLRLEIGDCMSRANRGKPAPYTLVAVLVHQGRSCDHGHYLAYVKSGADWYKANDATVTKTDVQTVLAAPAYILMYEVEGMREKHGFGCYRRYHQAATSTPTTPTQQGKDLQCIDKPLNVDMVTPTGRHRKARSLSLDTTRRRDRSPSPTATCDSTDDSAPVAADDSRSGHETGIDAGLSKLMNLINLCGSLGTVDDSSFNCNPCGGRSKTSDRNASTSDNRPVPDRYAESRYSASRGRSPPPPLSGGFSKSTSSGRLSEMEFEAVRGYARDDIYIEDTKKGGQNRRSKSCSRSSSDGQIPVQSTESFRERPRPQSAGKRRGRSRPRPRNNSLPPLARRR